MIDRGWRRSGTYCYKPDLRKSCCPQYTIKLDALVFKPGRSHRKLIHRWNRHILYGQGDAEATDVEIKQPKGRDNAPFDFVNALHSPEHDCLNGTSAKHKFEVILEPSIFTEEKFDLYCKYQKEIHHDKEKSTSGFKRFLVESPLQEEPIPYSSTPPSHLPRNYGSYHQLYRVDGQLVALAVLDILPNCVSSVYFMYDIEWEHYSLGKLSALREVTLAYEIRQAGLSSMGYLYMGFYIQSCQKMRYKGEYSPSYLVDPETYEWYPLEKCIPLLQKNRYACFSYPSHSIENDWDPINSVDEPELGIEEMNEIYVVQRGKEGKLIAVPLPRTPRWTLENIQDDIRACIRGLGQELAEDIFWLA